jgi:hypothetical protein
MLASGTKILGPSPHGLDLEKEAEDTGCQWLTPVILATQEAEASLGK